jgi:AcrR family transcriptional regulator
MKARTSKAEQGEATRAALVDAARSLFTESGYAGVGTEEIVRRAKVTRGALYHHFDDKQDLFRAVHEQIEEEVVGAIAAKMADVEDPIELLIVGTRAYLDVCTDPAIARITLSDAPSVLGWEEWREIDARYGLGLIMLGLQGGMDAGALRSQPVANAAEPAAARAEMEPALLGLIEGLRPS